MSKTHFSEKCIQTPIVVKEKLTALQKSNKRASGGKHYWVDGLKVHGIYEDGKGLRFRPLQSGQGGF
eukprot:CAMPEP_0178738914 /NCGR_PEP_ID=MMETSP0744-20121128/3774_1 /TAXON_ID=913974 /ORGANISM="Nitzschia punctata, Strain CCMP561" /LENGTH=66 /DNA_ID=CAMNT_0020391579 /DNA_START=517 /DNA_END=717 /DNA_ORIENTATION=-